MMLFNRLPVQLQRDGRLFSRVNVDASDGAGTITYVNGTRTLRLNLAQVVQSGPGSCLLKLPGRERPLRVSHPGKGACRYVGNVVLVETGATPRYWVIDNRVAAVCGVFAKKARFAGAGDVFRGIRSDFVWDASLSYLWGALQHATLRLFDEESALAYSCEVAMREPWQDRLPQVGREVVRGDVVFGGVSNRAEYGPLLRHPWSTADAVDCSDGVVVRTKAGKQFFATSEMRGGKVTRDSGDWLTVLDDESGLNANLHRHFAPANLQVGQRLRYFLEHRNDGGLQVVGARRP